MVHPEVLKKAVKFAKKMHVTNDPADLPELSGMQEKFIKITRERGEIALAKFLELNHIHIPIPIHQNHSEEEMRNNVNELIAGYRLAQQDAELAKKVRDVCNQFNHFCSKERNRERLVEQLQQCSVKKTPDLTGTLKDLTGIDLKNPKDSLLKKISSLNPMGKGKEDEYIKKSEAQEVDRDLTNPKSISIPITAVKGVVVSSVLGGAAVSGLFLNFVIMFVPALLVFDVYKLFSSPEEVYGTIENPLLNINDPKYTKPIILPEDEHKKFLDSQKSQKTPAIGA